MYRTWDGGEQGEPEAAYRAHLREMTTMRQAAEQRRELAMRRTLERHGDAEDRRMADLHFKQEMARVEEMHRAWLHAHFPGQGLPDEHHKARSRRVLPPG